MIPRLASLLFLAAVLAACRGEHGRSSFSADIAPAAPADSFAPAAAPGDPFVRPPLERVVDSLARTMPRFESHPAREVFRGTPAPVDLESAPGAREFRTVLREGAAAGPNFAGRYTVVVWGCGSPCQRFAVVDAKTGEVTFGPRSLTVGARYRLDSELLVADPLEHWRESYGELATEAIGGMAMATYYRWDGRRLVPLDSLPIGAFHFGSTRAAEGGR